MIESSLTAIVILSALLFGAVYPWTMVIVALLTMITFTYSLWRKNAYEIDFTRDKGILIALVVLAAYPLIQLIPLPLSFLGAIHHTLKDIVTISPNAAPLFHSISLYPFATELGAALLFLCLTVFSMAAFGIEDEEGVYKIVRALVIFAFVLGVFGIIQQATWNDKIYWVKRPIQKYASPFGPFVNRNHFAGFVGMIIPFSLGIAFMSRRIEKKVIYGFLGVVTTITLFFTLSRGGILSFFAGMLVFSFIVFTKGRSKRILIPVLLFVLVVGMYLIFFGISPVIEKFVHSEVSADKRLIVWKGTLSAFRDFPVFGSGLGTFEHIYKVYQPEGPALYWTHAHNDYIEFLLEFGTVGALIGALFLFFAFTMLMKTDWTGRELYLHAAFLSSITTIAVHSMFDFNLHIPSNAILFSLVLGLGVSLSRIKMNNRTKQDAWRNRQITKGE